MAAPMPMSRPVEEDLPVSDLSPDAAAEAPAAGSVVGVGVDGEGVDGRVQLGEGPDRAIKVPGEVVFGVAFHERLIGRGDRGPVVNVPHTGRAVANNNKFVEVFFLRGSRCSERC